MGQIKKLSPKVSTRGHIPDTVLFLSQASKRKEGEVGGACGQINHRESVGHVTFMTERSELKMIACEEKKERNCVFLLRDASRGATVFFFVLLLYKFTTAKGYISKGRYSYNAAVTQRQQQTQVIFTASLRHTDTQKKFYLPTRYSADVGWGNIRREATCTAADIAVVVLPWRPPTINIHPRLCEGVECFHLHNLPPSHALICCLEGSCLKTGQQSIFVIIRKIKKLIHVCWIPPTDDFIYIMEQYFHY